MKRNFFYLFIFLSFFLIGCENKNQRELRKAVNQKDSAKLESLLTSGNIAQEDMLQPCLMLIEKNEIDLLKIFFENNLDVNFVWNLQDKKNQVTYTNFTFISFAVINEKFEVIKFLIQIGANLNIESKYQKIYEREITVVPLYWAISENWDEYIDIFLDAGANPNFKSTTESPLFISVAMSYNLPLCEKLLIAGADINQTDSRGRTAFSLLASLKSQQAFQTAEFLLRTSQSQMSKEFEKKGNTYILSHENFKKLYGSSEKFLRVTAQDLCNYYDSIVSLYGNNKLMKNKKMEESKSNLIIINGSVSKVRRSIFNEYIVELKVYDNQFLFASDVAVVFPQKISSDMVNKLMNLNVGNYFEILAYTRGSYAYVDVATWNNTDIYSIYP